jgi:hypothetical protein
MVTGTVPRAPGRVRMGVAHPIGWPALSREERTADDRRVTTTLALSFVAARSRPHGPTAALWHAVEVHREPVDLDGACELTVCGSLARVTGAAHWPADGTDVCPTCATLAR